MTKYWRERLFSLFSCLLPNALKKIMNVVANKLSIGQDTTPRSPKALLWKILVYSMNAWGEKRRRQDKISPFLAYTYIHNLKCVSFLLFSHELFTVSLKEILFGVILRAISGLGESDPKLTRITHLLSVRSLFCTLPSVFNADIWFGLSYL